MSRSTRVDVWFCDDGKWRIDTMNAKPHRAAFIANELRAAGYAVRFTPTEPDGYAIGHNPETV